MQGVFLALFLLSVLVYIVRILIIIMTEYKRIEDIPTPERPYEKCSRQGVHSLSDVELLAVLLRTGIKGENAIKLSTKILHASGRHGLVSLHRLKMQELLQIKGIGKVKAIQILCLSELAKRLAKASVSEGNIFNSAKIIAEYFKEDMRHEQQEKLKLIMLNTKCRLIRECDISLGTVNSTLISPREIFIEALQNNAVTIVIMHNHPSGDPKPSSEDILMTERILKAGVLVGVELLDHIIIGDNCYYSFAEDGLIKKG